MSADGQMAPEQQAAPEAPVQAQDTQQAPDPLMARLDEMSQQIQSLSKAPQEPQSEWNGGISGLPFAEDPAQQGFDPNQQFQDPYGQQQPFDPYQQQYEPGQYAPEPYQDPQQAQAQAMQQLQGYIQQQVQQGVQQHVTPYIQQQRANELERQYPDLADPKVAGEIVNQTAQYAQKLGRPELARDPQLVELVYLAQQARSQAAQETPADGGQGVHLESGGAAPQQEEADPVSRMLAAHNKGFQ